jgi:hypothetical protein
MQAQALEKAHEGSSKILVEEKSTVTLLEMSRIKVMPLAQ